MNQGTLFGTIAADAPMPAAEASHRYHQRPRQSPPRRLAGSIIIAKAARAERPDVRNVAMDVGTIRRTDPKTGHRLGGGQRE